MTTFENVVITMKTIDPVYQTVYAELEQRSLDASFATDFPPDGRFVSMESKGRRYWYFDTGSHAARKRIYVGPADDAEISRRVEAFKDLKANVTTRRKLVTTLARDGHLPQPPRATGDIVQAIADAGFFRLRGVLVGTVAFQCYSALLAVQLPTPTLQTADADFAQFHSISGAVSDSMPPVLEVLRAVDPTFREIPHQADGRQSTKFRSRTGFSVEFLTPNRGSADHQGQPAAMPALGRAAAEPLRFLDFLIYQPVRAVLLHRAGIPVLVPQPARYAVHKLIVSARRSQHEGGVTKSQKDLQQAGLLIEALLQARMDDDLADAYAEAFDRGPHWREAMISTLARMEPDLLAAIKERLPKALSRIDRDPAKYLAELQSSDGDPQ
jgi:hypothetical protein